MTQTNTPQAALDIIANAVAQIEALHESLEDKVWDDETPYAEALQAAHDSTAMQRPGGILDAIQELQKKFS
jgi:hypothetical protein